MATLTIRNLDDALKTRLRVRAAEHHRSMEEEARQILGEALCKPEARKPENLADAIRRRFADLGGVELPDTSELRRQKMRDPPTFD